MIYKLRMTPGNLLRIVADIGLIQLSLVLAMGLRLYLFVATGVSTSAEQIAEVFRTSRDQYYATAVPLTIVCLVVFFLFGFYTYGRYYQGKYKALIVTQAVAISYLLFGFSTYFFTGGITVSRGGLLMSWLLTTVFLGGARVWNQLWHRVVPAEKESWHKSMYPSARRVLVIGGAGYIGSALLPKLLGHGYDVRVLDMLMFGDEPISDVLDHANLEVLRGDFRDPVAVVSALRGVDTVVHLGGIVGDPACSIDEELTIDVNLTSTLSIAHLAKVSGVRHFIFASTCSVYGACDEVLDERSDVRPVSLYGHTKLASERVLQKLSDDTFAVTIVRFATIYGLSGRTRFDLVVNLLAAKARIDGEITIDGGDQWRPFVHVSDAARAVADIIEAPLELVAGEIFNVGSNEQNYTIRQIGELVHERVMDARLVIRDNASDPRNYRVDFSKLKAILSFSPEWTVTQGIDQVLEAISCGDIVDYRDARYSNVKFLTQTGTNQLDRDRWARDLIDALTGPRADSRP